MSNHHEALKSAYEAFGTGDFPAAFEQLHDDCVLHEGSDALPYGGDFHGKQEIMGRWLPLIGAHFENLRLTLDELVGDGETVCVLGTIRGRIAGEDIKTPFCHVWHYEDDKVVDARFHNQQVDALLAIQKKEKAGIA
jgi:ketosteroid isomerase-like protein